jgi:hypothetical protein
LLVFRVRFSGVLVVQIQSIETAKPRRRGIDE